MMSKRAFACSSAAILIGYDMTLIGSIIANTEFVEFFGTYDNAAQSWALPASHQLIWSLVQYVSALVGALCSGLFNDTFGRRPAFLSVILCKAPFLSTSLSSPRANVRGFLLSLFQFWIIVGSFLAACVLEGTTHVPNAWPWKGTVVSQIGLGAICLALFLPVVPESPYYLVANSKTGAARAALIKLRGREVGYGVDENLGTIISTLEHERKNQSEAPSFIECFKGTDFRRTLIACLPMAMQHFMGYGLCGNYLAYFLNLSGFRNSFLITLISMFIGLFAGAFSFLIIEHVGRRPQLLFGSFVVCLCLLVIGILGFVKPRSQSTSIGVAILCIIWNAFYYISVGAVGWTITSEMTSSRLRSKSNALAAGVNSLFNMAWSIAIPYLVNTENANLGAKTGLVYFVPGVCLFVLAYFVVPETKGKTCDELDKLFEAHTPARKF
ncbi:hypothetical protein UA08_02058 [Talaromyces atroroseus]|uniref:Major facilitator superfamily (MFS) profile domain-containing protein n=1 Tax=Talaromyces atroroseus TaxID=1441469 RepID=A0A1Q5QC54_TALAT|nr:hypothetical protein UA08_02058 [Talaromyces atroroseus]OKL63513.1 hypothetical protein UA08_02058 [Talaromyces atroroseus]